MKKSELKELLDLNFGESLIQIDNLRTLKYSVNNNNLFISKNEYTQKRDILKISFRIDLGTHETIKDYNIQSRTEKEILDEIKHYTNIYFSEVAEYFNSNKCLANNW